MSMEYSNDNRGALFKNNNQKSEKHPDYKGTINVAGKDYDLAAWIKTSKKGEKYMSLSVSEKREHPAERMPERMAPSELPRGGALPADFNDEIPF